MNALGAQPSRHKCLIYDGGPLEHLPVTAPLAAAGLAEGRRCLVLGDDDTLAATQGALDARGVDTEAEIRRGALVFSSDRSYLGGGFEPARMVELLTGLVDSAVRDGFTGLWATGDMSWELAEHANFAKLMEYEALLERVFRSKPLSGVCQYRRSLLPPGAVHDALLTHRALLLDGPDERENRFFIPPELLLGARAPDGRRDLGEWMCEQIRRVQAAEAERDRLQAQVLQAQKMEVVGRLAGGVAHDFNNLLTAINGFASLARTALPPGSPAQDDLAEIERAGQRAAALTQRLLAFSRRQVIAPRPVAVTAAVEGMVPLLRRLLGEDVRLELRLSPDAPAVLADPAQLEQVVLNLVVNARDAMPAGGVLTLETAAVTLDADYPLEHFEAKAGPHAMLAVSDTGHGMTRGTLERLFEPFYTTKAPGRGTGLGLATIRTVVREAGGCVFVYSEPGQGTTFKVYLPVAEGAPPEAAAPPSAAPAPRAGLKVLLAEDDPQVRAFVRRVLSGAGYAVVEADSGPRAAALVDGGFSPDLLVTDLVLPGLRGQELARHLRLDERGLPVVFMSGYSEDGQLPEDLLGPRTRFVTKPIAAQDLLRAAAQALGGRA